jgi:hypothetical protein
MKGEDMNAQFAYTTPAQAQAVARLEALKKQGHSFIRVFYRGRQSMPALHGYYTIDVVQEFDQNEGKSVWKTRTGTSPIRFMDNGAGDMFADIYDCEHNRYALSRLIDFKTGNPPIPMIEVEDPKVSIELRKMSNKEYNVEPDKRTQILRQRAMLDAELAAMEDNDGPTLVESTEPEIPEPPEEAESIVEQADIPPAPLPISADELGPPDPPPPPPRVKRPRGRPRRKPYTQTAGA